jgi:hypothetical protein
MAMKLQWLPEPSSKGGWSGGHQIDYRHVHGVSYQGFDRFGAERATVTYMEHNYLPDKWHVSNVPHNACDSYEAREARSHRPTKKEAMLLAESFVEDDGE